MENIFEFQHILSPKRSAVPHRELHNKLAQEEGVRQCISMLHWAPLIAPMPTIDH